MGFLHLKLDRLKRLIPEVLKYWRFYQIADSEYKDTVVRRTKTIMLNTLTLNCALEVRANPQVIQNVLIPLAKWKVAPKIPSK
jgi:uncharacterized protein YqiB (DUF1249 family)